MIFISHRSIDKEIADMLYDFFVTTGIDKNYIFCSSLPGNDVKEKISVEVKQNLKKSRVNLVILSSEYYESAYCLNEAGIVWFTDDIPVIPIALPEITEDNMYGFLNSDYKIRRLDDANDISYIYDAVCKATFSTQESASVLTKNIEKLIKRYKPFIATRSEIVQKNENDSLIDTYTDDEIVALKYVVDTKIRKINRHSFSQWLIDCELYNININNAFDLLSSCGNSQIVDNNLELDVDYFRKLIAEPSPINTAADIVINKHQILSSSTFKAMWDKRELSEVLILFVSYIIDKNATSFGARWMAEAEEASIKGWEEKNDLESILSENYTECLNFFIENNFVYESDWTSYGNAREYSLCKSISKLFFDTDFRDDDIFKTVKQNYTNKLPF